ncbi:uncharacterized protein B0H64DRAFT_412709 [Chaetomium fimeti]|uniref:Uncharacterized protein n=1 Tax=Chaetomium fimeti TaxID=1854472 RepID=A0AAE0H641_9PEZI|nr:hypothetical protein B0H64DRAFT_412709 [Chaetomium fimeti]
MATSAQSERPYIPEPLRGWLPVVDDLIRGGPEGDFESIVATILKEYLLSDDDDAPATFARRFDDLYSEVYEPRFNGFNGTKKGWTGYLEVFYETVFAVAVGMEYDDPKQVKVIQLFSELRKLPTHVVKIFVQPEFEWIDSEIWTRDPLVSWKLFEADPGYVRAEDADNLKSQEDIDDFEASVAAFVSFHTFSARCTAAGLDSADRGRFHSQGSFISSTIMQPLGEFLDYQIMAVAQWILLSGDVIHAECVKKQLPPVIHRKYVWEGWENGNGPVVWKQWADKLAEIAAALEGGGDPGFKLFEKNREVLTDMVEKARDKMIALEPGLFTEPSPGPVTNPTPS